MEKFSLDKSWHFHNGDFPAPETNSHTASYMASKAGGAIGAASPDFSHDDWEKVDLPHDWAVYNEFEEKWGPANGYKKRGKGWYSKSFRLDEADKGKQLLIEFDGIATHSVIYFNGSVVGRNFSGYNSFIVDITDMAVYGEQLNTLTVFVDATIIEGWWYEGAGIYRHVKLYKKNMCHITHWGVFVHPEKKTPDTWDALTDTTVENLSDDDKNLVLMSRIIDKDGNVVGKAETAFECKAGKSTLIKQSVLTYSPLLWDIDSPELYTMTSELLCDGEIIDSQTNKFGFRTISIDKDKGFFLNGRHVPLYGTCNHQDHAGVGVAVPDSIQDYRVKLLKEMGSNAYRCAHGNPAPEILDACDKYGLLVMDENRNFNTSSDGIEQLRCMVMRDRNHPSVVMYSLFNEEPLQGTPTGRKLAKTMRRVVEELDNTRFTVGAMNTGVTSEAGACDVLDMTGFNYITHTYDEFREKYPNMPMLGSENDSAFETRGVYKTDYEKHIIDCYDSEAAPWGNTYRDGFKQIDTRKHILGMFIWTGFDYRGEPTPFEWPSIGTQFGIMDTCGFKKDAFYLNKAFFTEEPMIHVLPHWNWNEGETVKVMTHTNCEEAELFLNGISLGKKAVDKYDMAQWEVEFVPGELSMTGYRDGIAVCTDSVKTSEKAAKLLITPHKDFAYSDDAVAVNVCAVDENGIVVPYADNLVSFAVNGGTVIGVGNGDPNSHEKDKAEKRCLFNGKCQAIVVPSNDANEMKITAAADGLEAAEIILPVKKSPEQINYIASVDEKYIAKWRTNVALFSECPAHDMNIEDHDMNTWAVEAVGNGADEKYANSIGYGIYRTTVETAPSDKSILFKEITGNEVKIFINGEERFNASCAWGRKIEITDLPSGTVEIAVIINSTKESAIGGITKPVVILN